MAIYSRLSMQNTNNRRFRIWKTNTLLNFIENQPHIDKTYLHAKDSYESKDQHSINIREEVGLKSFNDPNDFTEYSNDIQDVYKNIDEYDIDQERKILIVFDEMIADMINDKKLKSIVTELFIRFSCFYYTVIL